MTASFVEVAEAEAETITMYWSWFSYTESTNVLVILCY